MKKKGEAHMEEKPKVKAKRKWTVVLIFILILGTIAAILAINRPIHSKKIREKKKAEVQIDTSQFTADSLQGLTASVSNLEAVKGYHPDASLNQITHDTNVIKKLEADISKVDFDTPGTYDITYNVTVYCKAYTAKANIAAPSSSVIISSAKATDGLTVEEILNNDSVFTDPIRAVNEENTGTENEDVDTQNADVAVQSMDDPSGKLLYSHSDLNDENETFYVPKVQTVLTNTANDHYFTTAAGSTLVDTVTYSGLKPGRAYTLTGKLMDKDTGKAATDKSGKEITGTATFTPSTANGTAKVNFSFDGSNLKGKTLVAYETLNGISVAYGIASSKKDLAIHKDISDADQSVTNMSLSTTAKDQKSGTKQVTLSRTAKIDDTVSYKGAIRGTSYKINGTLMNKSTGEAANVNKTASVIISKEITMIFFCNF